MLAGSCAAQRQSHFPALDRVAALRDGTAPKRAQSRETDQAAAALLAQRRILDANEETRLRALIQGATSLPQLPELSEPDPSGRQQVG